MKLHSPAWERGLRRRVRQAKRESRSLRRACRRQKWRRPTSFQWLGRPALTGWLVWVIATLGPARESVEGALSIISLWGLVTVVVRAAALREFLYEDCALGTLFGLPASSALAARWQWQRFLRQSLWSLVDFVAAYALVFAFYEPAVRAWTALLMAAVVQWLMVLALASLLVAWRPSPCYRVCVQVCFALGIAGTFLHRLTKPYLREFVEQVGPLLNAVLPFGWASHGLNSAVRGGHDGALLALLVGLILGAWFVRSVYRRLAARYDLAEIVHSSDVPDDVEEPPGARLSSEPGPTELVDSVRARQFLEFDELILNGPLERLFGRLMTARERTLIEFMRAGPLNWTRALGQAASLAVVGLAAAWLGLRALPQYRVHAGWALIVVGAVVALRVLPLASGFTRCFQHVQFWGGQQIGCYAGMPVAYHEAAWLVVKAALLRTLTGAPMVVGYGALAFLVYELSPVAGAALGLKVAWLVLAVSPALVAFSFSGGTGDSQQITFRGLGSVASAILLSLAFLGCAAAAFLFAAGPALIFAALACLPSLLGLWLYGWWFNRCRFDLVTVPVPSQS